MDNRELTQIKKNLSLLRQQKYGKEKARILAPEEEKVRIQLQIDELKAEIKEYEQ